MLQIKPHVGDTLRMRLDQQSEMTGVKRTEQRRSERHGGDDDEDVLARDRRGQLGQGNHGARRHRLGVVVDDRRARTRRRRAGRKRMRGQRVRFRVSPDGSVGMNEDRRRARRAKWRRSCRSCRRRFRKARSTSAKVGFARCRCRPATQFGAQLSGKLHVTFRFDSLTHGGDWAFVSMRGEMQPATGPGSASGVGAREGRRERHDAGRSEARLAHRVVVQHRDELRRSRRRSRRASCRCTC